MDKPSWDSEFLQWPGRTLGRGTEVPHHFLSRKPLCPEAGLETQGFAVADHAGFFERPRRAAWAVPTSMPSSRAVVGQSLSLRNSKRSPTSQRNVLRTLHGLAGKVGFHAFRRFRAAVVRKARVHEDLIGLWLSHAGRRVTDFHA